MAGLDKGLGKLFGAKGGLRNVGRSLMRGDLKGFKAGGGLKVAGNRFSIGWNCWSSVKVHLRAGIMLSKCMVVRTLI